MTSRSGRLAALALAAVALTGTSLFAADRTPAKESSSFGSLKAVDATEAQKQAEAWLKSVGKGDAATLAQAQKVWKEDRPVLDRVAATLALGDKDAAKALSEARDYHSAAPTALPALLKDAKKPAFLRANLAVAYGKALTGRKIYEEALEAFGAVKLEDVVDPSAYLFHKAVCEHALMLKERADASIDRLLVDASDAPERYRMVAALMHFDMLTWQEKDLGWIARKMDNIQRRLDLKRGGKHTQKIQKEVLVRLDEMIKEIENQQKQQGNDPNGGACPSGGQNPGSSPGTDKSSSPQRDTQGGTAAGTGAVDSKKVKEVAEVWGRLPDKERVAALRELTRTMPAKDRAVIEAYFRELQKRSTR
jgi:hypothetical protein